MQNLYSYLPLSQFRPKTLYLKPNHIPFLSLFSSLSSLTHSPSSISNASLSNFLIETLAISQPQALSISNRFSSRKSLEKPHSVVQFLEQLGFSDAHIRSSVLLSPTILFSSVDETLKPKLQFFQDLGLTGPDLGNFISKHSHFLCDSLEKTVRPCVNIIKKALVNDRNNQDLIWVLRRPYWVTAKPVSRLRCNIAFLESCGIVGPQLAMLLRTRPWLFFLQEPALRNLVSRVVDMGFPIGSRMLVHALFTVSGMSGETFSKKIELFQTFGFSEDECMQMFRKSQHLLGASERKLKFGLEFFLYVIKLERSSLVSWPTCLSYSMGKRIIPRYKVLQLIERKRPLKKEPSLLTYCIIRKRSF
ncbi:hypothetical protein RHMOL_Rhmol10G0231700 [Rhododendron molle]|uniref:Uncharacterized protein n=1 Tax=Rhododendron molle TaxID=49168 RepID=A0ACC0M6C9_RHOML|nr:hypothetical protein RHMOL_Rhmol10G0231700 [Rhododendron molle]